MIIGLTAGAFVMGVSSALTDWASRRTKKKSRSW